MEHEKDAPRGSSTNYATAVLHGSTVCELHHTTAGDSPKHASADTSQNRFRCTTRPRTHPPRALDVCFPLSCRCMPPNSRSWPYDRYMRVCTIPPDRIRYGRSPAAPAAPIPTPPRRVARSRVTTRTAAHRSSRPGKHRARTVIAASILANGYRANGHVDRFHGISGQGEDCRRHDSNIGNGENIDSTGRDTCRTSSGSGGRGRRVRCPLLWDDMHPWEQRNAFFLLCGDEGVQAHASEGSSISAEVSERLCAR